MELWQQVRFPCMDAGKHAVRRRDGVWFLLYLEHAQSQGDFLVYYL